ncbi:hypothetical protein CASFOL_022132 [Castilleja foliolosa]|uniref:Uncharacterized protein n=1 Tax=Castilleja foliolosa TaxID=1961234 RepID=A0ABD3CYJ3_9LAMI
MKFNVTCISEGMVVPSSVTPSGVYELSAIDKLPSLRCNVPSLHVYKHGGPGSANTIREALSKALVYYYPLAGRLQVSDRNELRVVIANCSGSSLGVWFVEASADCTLDAVNYFDDDVMSIPYDKLLPHDHDLDDHPVKMQVTRFECNGFVVGLIVNHTIMDGVGTAQLMNAVGETARGAEQLSIKPEWCRNFLPAPTRLFDHHPNNPNHPTTKDKDCMVEHATIDFSLYIIKDLKQEFQKWSQSNEGIVKEKTYCSTFEISAAIIWQARTRAINPIDENNNRPMKLVFYANCRHLIPQLPKGFYGNCFFPVTVTAPSGRLANMTLFQVVKLIQDAKAQLADKFRQWTLAMDTNPFEEVAPDYATISVTEWDRLGFKDVDYGWGKPINVVPIQESAFITPTVVISSPPPDKAQVLRFKTWCVEKRHLQPLLRNMDIISETRV